MLEIEKIIKNVEATMAMEGNKVTGQDIAIMQQYLTHEITKEQGIEQIKENYR